MTSLILYPDLNCEVYLDTEFHGYAKACEEYIIKLELGVYWIECVSQENSSDRTDFDFRTDGSDFTEYHSVEIKHIRYKRLISQYDFVGEFQYGFAEVKKNDKTIGYIDQNGNIRYSDIYLGNKVAWNIPKIKNLIIVRCGGWDADKSQDRYVNKSIHARNGGPLIGANYGYINYKGEEIIPCKYNVIRKFTDELYIVCRDVEWEQCDVEKNLNWWSYFTAVGGKWGIIDSQGHEIIECIYDEIYNLVNGIAIVKKNNQYGFINRDGIIIIQCKYEDVHDFQEELAAVKHNGNWGFINKEGTIVIPCEFEIVEDFIGGVTLVNNYIHLDKGGNNLTIMYLSKNLSGYTVLDRHDRLAIKNIEYFRFFHHKKNGCSGFLDKNGEIISSESPDLSNLFNNGLAKAYQYIHFPDCLLYGFIDKTGKKVTPFKYETVNDFSEGLAGVKFNGKWGFINTDGQEIIVPQYEEIKNFRDGQASVKCNGEWGIIDKTGKFYIPDVYKILRKIRN